MSDPTVGAAIKPQYFSEQKRLPERILDRALGEIKADRVVQGKFTELAYHRSVEGGRMATKKAAEKMGTNKGGISGWLQSGAAKLATGAKPEDYGKQVQSQLTRNPEARDTITGMMKIGAAAKAIQEADANPLSSLKGIKEGTGDQQNSVFKALAMLGRNEKPSAKSITDFMAGQREAISKSTKLPDRIKDKYIEKLGAQEAAALQTLKDNPDAKQVDVHKDVLMNSVKLDPDFKDTYDPTRPLGSLTKEYIEGRSEAAMEDGFEEAFKPQNVKFSESNIDNEYNQNTFDAARGIDVVLEPFEESDENLSHTAQNMLVQGLNEEIEGQREENKLAE